MELVLIALAVFSLFAVFKWFTYYCAFRGVTYHAILHYNWNPSDEEIKKLQSMAVERTLKEFFGKSAGR